jgi:uncharacterized protein
MKLQPDRADKLSVTSHGPGWFAINGERFEHSLVITSEGEKIKWPCEKFEELNQTHFDLLLNLKAEIVLVGTGSKHFFPQPELYQSLIEKGIGLESMNTAAACRTFNILSAEHRQVAAVLLTSDPS